VIAEHKGDVISTIYMAVQVFLFYFFLGGTPGVSNTISDRMINTHTVKPQKIEKKYRHSYINCGDNINLVFSDHYNRNSEKMRLS